MIWSILALAMDVPVPVPVPVPVQEPAHAQLAPLVGDWEITDASGTTGHSRIVSQAPGAMLYELRDFGPDGPLPIWFEYSERTGGWVQLFPSPAGIREFPALSPRGQWPIIFGGDVTLRNGAPARFRLTMSQPSVDRGERRLEMSQDNGTSWQTVFAFAYRRVRDGN